MDDTVTMERSAVVSAGLTAVMWGLTGILVRLLPPLSPFTVTTGRLLGALVVALPMLSISNAKRLGLRVALKSDTP
jgi:drug/metabolite transporter (DMT)-like permease